MKNNILFFVFGLFSVAAAAPIELQPKLDAAAKAGGGRVVVPAGEWATGPLTLGSGVELHLEYGARLVFSDDPSLYPNARALVMAVGATNVSVTGTGTFEAKVDYWHGEAFRRKIPRPRFFQFKDCGNVRFEGFRVRNSPNWTIHLLCTDDVTIRNLDLQCDGPNTDGIDLDSVQRALIENCRLDQGDDGFCMKSGKNADGRRRARPTKDVTIRNCTVVNGHTLLGIGSELSGGIENITLENCRVEGEVWRVLLIKTNAARGGYVRNISVRNVTAARAKCSIFEIMPDYQWLRRDKPTNPEIVYTPMENVTVENVVCDEGWYAYELRGDPACPPKNITLRNCEMKNPSRGEPIAKNIDSLKIENVKSGIAPFSVWCDDPDSNYRCGDEAVFTVCSSLTTGVAKVRLDNFGDKVLSEFDVDLSRKREFTVKGGRDIPGFLLLTVKCGKHVKRWGAVFSKELITSGDKRPADFEKFWRDAIARYDREVPEDVKLELLPSMSTNGCNVYMLSLSDPRGRTVYGFLKEPKDLSKGPFPVRVHVPGAGPSMGTTSIGDASTIGLLMNVHYYRPVPGAAKRGPEHNALQKVEDDCYSKLYPVLAPRYTRTGIAASREEYFYYGAILAINRAVEWLRRRPESDDSDFTYSGGSQGGGMGLALVALNGGFRKATIAVPAITAHLCHKIDGRQSGWPNLVKSQLPENVAAAERNAPYFDGVHFASLITCPIRFTVGFTDTVAPPHAGFAALNACPSKDKDIYGSIGYGHATSKVESSRMSRWIDEPFGPEGKRIEVYPQSFDNGGWKTDVQFMDVMGSPYLLAHGCGLRVLDATARIEVPETGDWRVWVRSRKWTDGAGAFKVRVGGAVLAHTFGVSQSEWAWEDGGTVRLEKGTACIALKDEDGFDGRCAGVVLIKDGREDCPPVGALDARVAKEDETVDADFVVVGGGLPGTCAAVAAARRGMKVALIQDRPVLGGNSSSEIRVWSAGESKYPLVRELRGWFMNRDPNMVLSDANRMRIVQDEKTLHLHLCTRVFAAETENGKITSVKALDWKRNRVLRFRAPLFCDATGDGWLGYFAGADWRMGREARDEFDEPFAPEKPDSHTLGASLMWTSAAANTDIPFSAPWAEKHAQGVVAVRGEWNWEYGIRRDIIEEGEAVRDRLFLAIYGAFSLAKKNPVNSRLVLDNVPFLLGKRESRRLLGDWIYSEKDVTENRTFEDAIAAGSWSVDLHYDDFRPGVDFLTTCRQPHYGRYWIPYRSIYSRNISNLFMAGRCFSCTHVGLGGPRVVNTLSQLGCAAGEAAAMCKVRGCEPRDIWKRGLVRELQRNLGGDFPGNPDPSTKDWIIVDDETPGVKFGEKWKSLHNANGDQVGQSSHYPPGGHGWGVDFVDSVGVGDVTYPLPVKKAGRYRLLWRVPYMHSAKTESATVLEISSGDYVKRITVNQSIGTGTWQEAGVFDFAPDATLRIIASKSYGVVIADGFALVHTDSK